MFGDMFDECDHSVPACGPNPTAKINGGKFEAPPPLRAETGFCGIKNQGATCYLNSLIQTLLLTPEFREELFRLGPDELGKLEDVRKKNSKVRIIPIQLQLLLARLLLLDQNACGTENLTESFGWVENEELQQHDVQELSRILFCAIEDSLVGTSGHAIIKNLYRGVTANTITCLNCGTVSERKEEFVDLNIAIAVRSSLTAVLRDMFVETELMNGKNQYHCDKCAKLVDARKGAVIKTLPPILTMSLLRFSFDYSTLRRFKETRKFEFPLSLNMRDFCEKTKGSKDKGTECYEYDLYSVIIHSGSAHGGHYHAYIRDVDGLGSTPPGYDPTPPKVSLPESPKVDTAPDRIEDPLEMVAAVLGKLGGENVPLNKLGEAFREESGTSWSKQYKRKYGTMIKFLQSCYETFVVDTRAKTVSFRTTMPHSSNQMYRPNDLALSKQESALLNSDYNARDGFTNFENADALTIANGYPDMEKQHGDCVNQSGGNNETHLKQCEYDFDSDSHPLCNVWFDFNDSNVKSITTHDIERKFEGRESAYMLFYRRRDLKRPLLSLGNTRNGIPDHIIAQIQEENCNLEHLRNEYDVYLNVVSVEVFFPRMFKHECGLLKFIEMEPSPSGFSFSIDRRKTMSDVITELLNMAEKHEQWDLLECKDNLQCNILKVLDHGGIHVFEQVDHDRNLLVCNSLLENDQKLLLWNGENLAGTAISPGVENEPKVLNIHCSFDGKAEVSCFDYKGVAQGNVTVRELQQYFLSKLRTQSIISSKMEIINDNGSLQVIEEENYEKPIRNFVKGCNGNLVLQVKLGNKDEESEMDNDLTLNVSLTEKLEEEVRDAKKNGTTDKFVMTSVNCKVKVGSFIFIEHLKSKIPRWLFPESQTRFDLHNLNLCIEDAGTGCSLALPKISLHEQQSLVNAGLSNDTFIKLDIGPPLERNSIHILVYVQKGNKLKLPVKKCQSSEIVCNVTHTVSNLIDEIITKLNLSNDPHHLRMLKSEKEVGDVVTEIDMAVEKTSIHHGCALVICQGSIPSEGQLRVPVWFYPSMCSFNDLRTTDEKNQNLSPWETVLINEISPTVIGCIEIDKDATLFDFKNEILKLDFIRNQNLEDVEGICLRSMSHKLPTRFHLQNSASIKRLRLGPNNPVAVQESSCVPQNNYTTLHLSFNIVGTRQYTNACELQWEKSANLAQFSTKLAERFKVPVKDILIARRGDDPWDWEIIKTRDSEAKAKESKNTTKGKKGSKQKNKGKNKRQSGKFITSLQDGDVIRVKRLVSGIEGAPEVTDFKSDEDLALLKRWNDSRLKDNNNLSKEESQSGDATKKNKPKKEETLRIHVDKF